jgi:tRNA threonylcarbamoyladenosine modification (KEOPS) complex  Pcc1 subunit
VRFREAQRVKTKKASARGKRGPSRGAPFVATLTVEVGTGRQREGRARAMVKALAPEAGKGMPGTDVKVRAGAGGVVEVVIKADTMPTLRAAVNSYLRVASLAQRVAEVAWSDAPGA